jgi:RimJ/RimL family protein N-acetyltransferase/predicted CoA-binding protein
LSATTHELRSTGAVDVILRDGSTLRLRAPVVDDADALEVFFGGLSERSFYLRFHGLRHVDRALIEHFLEPDWRDRGVLVGLAGEERIVAVAEFMRLRDETSAEVAFAVTDELQGRGVGTRLLEQLASRAAATGIERFVAQVLPENAAMLGVFRDAGFEVARELDCGEIEVRFPIATTERYRARVDERDHLAVTTSLKPFFAPHSLVVVGASPRRGSIGGELFRNVLAGDFEGVAYPVNRDGRPVGGVRGYRSIDELPETVDLAVICLPARHVLGAAEAALTRGIKAVCVISSGFAEVGAEGAELH